MAHVVHTNLKIWVFLEIFMRWLIELLIIFYVIHIQGWLRWWCHVLSISRFWKIILYATFLRVWCMCNTISLMLKEFFQAFAWYIHNIYDELIFIIVVIMCFPMKTIVTDIFVTQWVRVNLGYRSISLIDNLVSIGKFNVIWSKPIITISQHAICVKFPLLLLRVWKYFNFP